MSVKIWYCDADGKALVQGPQNAATVQLSAFILTDAIPLNIYAQSRSVNYPLGTPLYVPIQAAGLALSAVVGIRDGTDAPLLASQFAFVSDPNTGAFWTGTLNLNTPSMVEFMAANPQINAWLEIFFLDGGGNRTTILEVPITIYAPVYDGQPPVPVPPLVGSSQQWTSQTFVPQMGANGQGFYLVSPDGTKKIFVSCGNDGALHEDQIS
jgi:hypothetical protein